MSWTRKDETSKLSRALNGINGAGQDRIVVLKMRNGTVQDTSEFYRTGRDRNNFSKIFQEQDKVNPLTHRYLTGYPVEILQDIPRKFRRKPDCSCTNLALSFGPFYCKNLHIVFVPL